MLGERLHLRVTDDVSGYSNVVREKAIGGCKGHLCAQRIMSLLQ